MATHSRRERPFPALVIAFLLLLVGLFAGQYLAPFLPQIAGLATLHPGLTVFDIPVHGDTTIDLVLVPGLFFLGYAIVLLLYPRRRPGLAAREFLPRMGAVLAGSFILVFCTAAGYLAADLLQDHLPRQIRNGVDSLGINADIALPFSDYKSLHLRGDIISLLFLIIGIALFIRKINRTPNTKKRTPLTREQRMSPYERMLREKKARAATSQPTPPPTPQPRQQSTRQPAPPPTRQPRQQSTQQITPQPTPPPTRQQLTLQPTPKQDRQPPAKTPKAKTPCHNHPLHSLEPESAAYMPLQ